MSDVELNVVYRLHRGVDYGQLPKKQERSIEYSFLSHMVLIHKKTQKIESMQEHNLMMNNWMIIWEHAFVMIVVHFIKSPPA